MSRVLPTPVASVKQSEGNSHSKLVTLGNSWLIFAKLVYILHCLSILHCLLIGKSSQIRAFISNDCRCGGGRLRRLPILLRS
jgi:uncharacterized membrane protein